MGTFLCLASRPDAPVPVFFNLTNEEAKNYESRSDPGIKIHFHINGR